MQEDKVIFFVYRGDKIESWFSDMKTAIEFTILNGLVLERVHLKADGGVHRMILYEGNKNEADFFAGSESPL